MIESDIELKIKTKLAEVLVDDKCEIVGSWQPADVGSLKGEHDKTAKAVVSIYVQPRQHDSFSLPTVNLNGTVAIDCRIDQCPTMLEVSEIYEKVLGIFDDWHYHADDFSQYLSGNDFFATEIMLSGGDKVTFNSTLQVWTVTLGFTIRGSVKH